MRGGPERGLRTFSVETRSVREQLTSPLQSLPALESAEPFVFEVTRDADGVLRQRQATIVLT